MSGCISESNSNLAVPVRLIVHEAMNLLNFVLKDRSCNLSWSLACVFLSLRKSDLVWMTCCLCCSLFLPVISKMQPSLVSLFRRLRRRCRSLVRGCLILDNTRRVHSVLPCGKCPLHSLLFLLLGEICNR